MSQIIELAKKLKALAEQGVDGERNTAKLKLESLMAKHNIKPEDLEVDIIIDFDFTVYNRHKQLFIQIVANTLDDPHVYKVRGLRRLLRVPCTASEAVEIQGKFDFFKAAYQKQMEIFQLAFFAKNNLFSKKPKENNKELTKEEKEKYWKAAMMAEGMDKDSFHKQITNT